MKIEITTPYKVNDKTGLNQNLKFTSLSLNKSGYLNLSMSVDILDNEGQVFVNDSEQTVLEIHPTSRYEGDNEIPASSVNSRQQELIDAISTAISNYMEGEKDNV